MCMDVLLVLRSGVSLCRDLVKMLCSIVLLCDFLLSGCAMWLYLLYFVYVYLLDYDGCVS